MGFASSKLCFESEGSFGETPSLQLVPGEGKTVHAGVPALGTQVLALNSSLKVWAEGQM